MREPPDADTHARWCGEGRGGEEKNLPLPDYAIISLIMDQLDF